MPSLAGLDLNLLVVLDALLAERHVTRAAARVGLSQPAASHALTRLRALFDDPLLIRVPGGMEPTAFAISLTEPLERILRDVRTLVEPPRAWSPETAEEDITLGLSDYAAFVLLPRLLPLVRQRAPGLRLLAKPATHGTGHAVLEEGAAAVVGVFPDPKTQIRRQTLYHEDFLVIGRANHPAFVAGRISLEAWSTLPHLHVSTTGSRRGWIDEALGDHARRIVASVGHFALAPLLVDGGDLIATEPRRLVAPLAARLGLATAEVPLPVPGFATVMDWHKRTDSDPAAQFIRNLIIEALSSAPG